MAHIAVCRRVHIDADEVVSQAARTLCVGIGHRTPDGNVYRIGDALPRRTKQPGRNGKSVANETGIQINILVQTHPTGVGVSLSGSTFCHVDRVSFSSL